MLYVVSIALNCFWWISLKDILKCNYHFDVRRHPNFRISCISKCIVPWINRVKEVFPYDRCTNNMCAHFNFPPNNTKIQHCFLCMKWRTQGTGRRPSAVYISETWMQSSVTVAAFMPFIARSAARLPPIYATCFYKLERQSVCCRFCKSYATFTYFRFKNTGNSVQE